MSVSIEYADNFPEIERKLRRAGVLMQVAAEEALNQGAEFIQHKHRALMRNRYRRASNYTLNATRVMRAHGTRRDGSLRRLRDINAMVVVRQMPGGRDHYLAKKEEGGVRRGSARTGNKVPIPLNAARRGGNPNAGIAPAYAIGRKPIQQDTHRWKSATQFYGAARAMVRRGALARNSWIQNAYGVFQVGVNKIKMLRNTESASLPVRSEPLFEEATAALSERVMRRVWQQTAERLIRQITR